MFMAEPEEKILRKAEFKPYLWWKYIDDIFFLGGGGHGKKKLKPFTKMNPTIKFTIDWSKRSIHFLDVTISTAEGVIEIDLYVRSTNRHQDLLSSSCHPFYCKKGIPYSM